MSSTSGIGELAVGVVVDRYRLVERLGEGGQGAVWRVEDPLDPDTPKAVKLIRVHGPNNLERARREAHALARLDHPSLVRCHALFEDLRLGMLGLVMDFVKGKPLSEAAKDERMTPAHTGLLLTHLAAALAHLHAANIVHRDLKAENVLLADGFFTSPGDAKCVKLVDLGIATASDAPRLTALGSVIGTVPYLAPELLDPGAFRGGATAPTVDVFAFGVLASWLLDGVHPTGLTKGGAYDYAQCYRALDRQGARLPVSGRGDTWSALLQDALALHADDRIPDGAALLLRCREADGGVVAQPRGAATAVATPSAMLGDTELAQGAPTRRLGPPPSAAAAVESATPASHPVSLPTASTPGRTVVSETANPGQGSSAGGLALASLLVAAAAAGVAWFAFDRDATAPPTGSATASAATAAPEPEPSADAGTADAAVEAAIEATIATPATLPDGCTELCPCCPAGQGCGDGGCDEPLAVEAEFTLRVGEVLGERGAPLVHEGAELCALVAQQAGALERCVPLQPSGPNQAGLRVTRTEIDDFGLRLRLRAPLRVAAPMPEPIYTELATTTLKQAVSRKTLCKGIEISDWQAHVKVERVVLYLDPATGPAPSRCPP